jgi:RNase P/RNase MRP subunit POP5
MGLATLKQNFLSKFSQFLCNPFERIVKFWNPVTRIFIARVGRENLQLLQTAVCLMTEFEGSKCRFRILHVGGTLEKIEQQYKTMSEEWLEQTSKKL